MKRRASGVSPEKKGKTLSVPADAAAPEVPFLAVLVDGAWWRRGTDGTGFPPAGEFMRQLRVIEDHVGLPVGHVTMVESDPDEWLVASIRHSVPRPNELVPNLSRMVSAAQRAERCHELYNDLREALATRLELQYCGMKMQKMTVPHYVQGLVQQGADVMYAVRALEYVHGTARNAQQSCLPKATHLAVIAQDSDFAPVLQTLMGTAPDLPVYLCGFRGSCEHGKAVGASEDTGRVKLSMTLVLQLDVFNTQTGDNMY